MDGAKLGAQQYVDVFNYLINYMKRTLFIIVGSASLLLIFIFWLYLLVFGTPQSVDEVVGDFGFEDITVTPINPALDNPSGERTLDLNAGSLYQLTLKPVAGFDFIREGENSGKILYAERGVGHIYQIDIASSLETRVLQKTFVGANQAYFSLDGSAVVVIGENEFGQTSSLEEIDQTKPPHQFPAEARNIKFTGDREVSYTLTSSNGTIGYVYDLDSAETNTLFNTALKDINVIWGENEILVYSRSAPTLSGTLYRISGNTLTVAGGISGVSYSAITASDQYIETARHLESGDLVSRAAETVLGLTTLPEKCTTHPVKEELLWCGSPVGLMRPTEQSNWYKGLTSFVDSLWQINLQSGEATEVENVSNVAGRSIDMAGLRSNDLGTQLIFKNKNDDTLWLKRLGGATTNEDLLEDSEEVTNSEI